MSAALDSASGAFFLLLARAADIGIGLELFAILAGFLWITRRRSGWPSQDRVLAWASGGFLLLVGAVHIATAFGPQTPSFGWLLSAKVVAAILGGVVVVLLWRELAQGAPAAAAGFAGLNKPDPRASTGRPTAPQEPAAARPELAAPRLALEAQLEERTRELGLAKARLETALHGAQIHAFSQDRELRYTWAYNPDDADAAAEMIGRTDSDLLPAQDRDAVIAVKQRVLATGRPETCEACSVDTRGQAHYSYHIAPSRGRDGAVDGITGVAIDISRIRSLESEQRRLADELRGALQCYEIALRGSHVTLFTQDRDQRFTSISNPLFGREVEEIVGRTAADILPAESREQFGEFVRAALASGHGQGGEVSVKEADKTRWYDLHVEPLPDDKGNIIGVTCALFDITDRKTSEGHLRLLMRELTHRSKNLLAVIQSMARQTARHAGTIDSFLETFGDRLQALATSHDLLVQEGWYGASLQDLTRRQLAKYLDGAASRVTVSGPAILLKPAAAQSVGLALHELAMNAERFGALSVPKGRVEVVWRKLPSSETVENDGAEKDGAEKEGVEIVWAEIGGPDVTAPSRRGFGSLVVEKNLSRALDADVALTFEPTGVRCRMLIPATHLLGGR
ncbi:MAG: HWE histidine kinase domain-containing protein [Xanthobacteraceae bacterium]